MLNAITDCLAIFGALVIIAAAVGMLWVLTRGPDDFGV